MSVESPCASSFLIFLHGLVAPSVLVNLEVLCFFLMKIETCIRRQALTVVEGLLLTSSFSTSGQALPLTTVHPATLGRG